MMVSNPRISIIVPIYRVETYLRQCLDSIVNQTYLNLEIILVDDGSPDHCGDICDEYADRDERVRVIHKENEGLSSARNTGLQLAAGEFVAFVDSDDILSPVFIQSLLSADADVAQCGYTSHFEKLKMDFQFQFEYLNGREMSERLCTEGAAANTVVWSKLWKRELFCELRFPEGRIHEDEFVTWKVFWKAKRVARTGAPLYYYRKRQGSIMSKRYSAYALDRVDALRERISFYENAGATKLADLSKAAFCCALCEIQEKDTLNLSMQISALGDELCEAYSDVIHSEEIGAWKKTAVTLQMISPRVYSALKTSRKWLEHVLYI